MAKSYKIISMNCRGLNNKITLNCFSSSISKLQPGILLLQEKYLPPKFGQIINLQHFRQQFMAPGSSKSRGTVILFCKILDCK